MENQYSITNEMTRQCIIADEFTLEANWIQDDPIQTRTILPGDTQRMSGRQRFYVGNTHYSVVPSNGDEIVIRDPKTLQLSADTQVVAYPCCWEEIDDILRQIRLLELQIQNNPNEDDRNTLLGQLNALQKRLRESLGNPDDDSWREFAIRTGIASLVAGAYSPAGFVAFVQGMGFTAGGIGVGTPAAWLMSLWGGATPAGGIVATLQSIGAVGVSVGAAAALAATGVVVTTAAGYAYFSYSRDRSPDGNPDIRRDCWRICRDRFNSNLS